MQSHADKGKHRLTNAGGKAGVLACVRAQAHASMHPLCVVGFEQKKNLRNTGSVGLFRVYTEHRGYSR